MTTLTARLVATAAVVVAAGIAFYVGWLVAGVSLLVIQIINLTLLFGRGRGRPRAEAPGD